MIDYLKELQNVSDCFKDTYYFIYFSFIVLSEGRGKPHIDSLDLHTL